MDVDATDAVFAAGSLSGDTDFDPSASTQLRSTAGGNDAFLMRLSSAGAIDWVETFGGSGNDVAFGVAVDGLGELHFAGYFQDTADFVPDLLETYYLTSHPGQVRGFRLRLRLAP